MTLTSIALRNVLQDKFRVTLTVLAIAVSMFTFLLVQAVLAGWKGGGPEAVRNRVVGSSKTSIDVLLPTSYMETIATIPHVKASTYNWTINGKDPAHPTAFFVSIAVDPKTYLDVFPDFVTPAGQAEAWKVDRGGALVGEALANSMGWKIGDRVSLEIPMLPNPAGGPWLFTIRAIYTTTAKSLPRKSFFCHFDYLNEARPVVERNTFTWYTALIDDPRNAAQVITGIDQALEHKEFPTVSMDEETYRASILAGASLVKNALQVISFILLTIMLLILGNTISMAVRERTNQYGVLRAIGFLPRHVVMFILTEGMLIGAMGGLVGLGTAVALIQFKMKKVIENEASVFFPGFSLPITSVILAIVMALALGPLAALLPARRASRMTVTQALQRGT